MSASSGPAMSLDAKAATAWRDRERALADLIENNAGPTERGLASVAGGKLETSPRGLGVAATGGFPRAC